MTDLERLKDRPPARLVLVAGVLLGTPMVCAAVALYRHGEVVCCVLQLVAAPVAAVACGRLLRLYRRRVAGARAVSDAVQQVLLRPLPSRIGGLDLASVYRACGGQARVGGDLYAVARADAATRVVIGDVRGRGLPSFLDVIAILGAFREWAPQPVTLAELSARLEESFLRYLAEADGHPSCDADERFATLLVLEVPDGESVARMVNFGHPPPVRARSGEPAFLQGTSCPPLGLSPLCDVRAHESAFELGPDDTLLLYTDGLIEARDSTGGCFPLLERAATWTWHDERRCCEERLHDILGEILDDVVAHCGTLPADDLAMIALARHGDGGAARVPRPAGPGRPEGAGPAGQPPAMRRHVTGDMP
ncbi:PP2C family protein-serine/threonine phosphatase [Actinacidiphila glaucinigra]|uniref:Serine phosphatase RsbU, regulator of sigma subunit n=1 Tax=Actinacidiphila glaucinigra TaxID=235986 RepID=A0A239NZ56_9ACTN|nr:Serine phosphatase RsbU, regulator of sigma subunit [Actinacidiphila glaucinigra]